jgi:hypothetical protein
MTKLEQVSLHWQSALDAAFGAACAVEGVLPHGTCVLLRRRVAAERQEVGAALSRLGCGFPAARFSATPDG